MPIRTMHGEGRVMTPTATRAAQWLLAIGLATAFTAFQIQSSLHSGSLSLPVTYDDVGYFNDVLPRLDLFYREGGWALLKGFWLEPLHAPLQELLALTGFAVFGRHPWAADAMNAIPLGLMLRLYLGYATRSLGFATSAITATAFLGYPLLGLLILEFRPDMLCALLTAAGALVVVADADWRQGRRASLASATALFAGALLAKPTLAPVTGFVFAIASLAAVVLHSKSRDDVKRLAWLALVCGGVGVLIVLPYYASHLSSLIAYIYGNAFGSQAAVWRQNLSWTDHAVYYLTGPGGDAAIGQGWIVMGVVLMMVALPILSRARQTAIAVFIVAVAAYFSVTLPGMKSPFIGLIVPAFVLGILVMLVIVLLRALPPRISPLVAIGFLALSAATWQPVSMRLLGAAVPNERSRQYMRIYDQTADALASIPDLDRRRLYFPVIAQYLNPDNVQFELRRRGLPVAGVEYLYFSGDLAAHKAGMDRSDVVILFSEDSGLPMSWPASTGIRKEIEALVSASGQFQTVATVEGGPLAGRIIVLKRK